MINLRLKRFFQYALLGEELRLAENVIITTENGFIIQIDENASFRSAEEVFSDSLVIPAFVNAHTHLGDVVAKEAAWNATLDEAVGTNGVKFRKFREEAAHVPKAIHAILQNMAQCGVAAFVDFREGGIEGVSLLRKQTEDYPGKAVILGRPSSDDSEMDAIISSSDGLGLPTTTYFSDKELQNIQTKVHQSRKPLAVHCAETIEERERSLELYNQNDVLRAIHLLGADTLIHMTHATPEDLLIVKKHDISLVFCPRSNAYFSTGFPPVQEALDLKIPAALGTDNVMVNHPDPLQEARWLALQLRLRGKKPTPQEILSMITVNPASIFNLASGALAIGKRADLVTIDLTSPRTAYCDDPLLALLMRATPEDYLLVSYGDNVVFSRKKRS
ncbi:MAG: amidohydrolase family protein [Candidatus Thorarchaeota archaeon]